jgi:hypothetical protein
MVNQMRFDKHTGKRILPDVKIGNERMVHSGGSALSGSNFVLCESHGQALSCWVRWGNTLYRCCRFCITQYCPLTVATHKIKPLPEPETPGETPDTHNPVGHSY